MARLRSLRSQETGIDGAYDDAVARVHEIEELPAMLVLWGDRDGVIPFAQGRAFAESLEGARFRAFPGAGHYLHNEQPEEFVRVVRAFLDDPAAVATRFTRR